MPPIVGAMDWSSLKAPSLDDLKALAESALERLPAVFRAELKGIAILIEEFPDDETMEALDLETPYDILGLYQGVDLTRKSTSDIPPAPDIVFLYRRPILDVWAEGEETLDALVTHVLVHEIGHHFGLSDETMEALEAAVQAAGSADPQDGL